MADDQVPEKTVAHDEEVVRGLSEQNRLSVTEITYGNWCGRKEYLHSLQDVLIAIEE